MLIKVKIKHYYGFSIVAADKALEGPITSSDFTAAIVCVIESFCIFRSCKRTLFPGGLKPQKSLKKWRTHKKHAKS